MEVAAYKELTGGRPDHCPPLDPDERAPLGPCCTSGTTGRPKDIVRTHRSTVPRAMTAATRPGAAIGPSDRVLPLVPMFHANTWGLPYTATAYGAKQVFHGGRQDPSALVELMAADRVTVAAGVPAVWLSFADAIAAFGGLSDLRRVMCGGARPPDSLTERCRREFGIPLIQGWGMTETSPPTSTARPKEWMSDRDESGSLGPYAPGPGCRYPAPR